jgi:hypothetical protein
MKKSDRTKEELREIMIDYLDYLLKRDHIECRSTLAKYRLRLMIDEVLTPKQLGNIIKFLIRDSDLTGKELRQIFLPLVQKTTNTKTKIKEETASLTQFFT